MADQWRVAGINPEVPHRPSGKHLLPCQDFPDRAVERPDCRFNAAGLIVTNVADGEQIWIIDRGCAGTAAVGITKDLL